MPPHCDALDGPVVAAALEALKQKDVAIVLPYVPAEAEAEVENAYMRTIGARSLGDVARDVADRWFCETVVRLHRAGEGAPYTGLKPAGLDVGPVIPVADQAIRDRDPEPLIEMLTGIVREQVERRFQHMLKLKNQAGKSREAARSYVSAMLGLQVWSHKLALTARAAAHDHGMPDEH